MKHQACQIGKGKPYIGDDGHKLLTHKCPQACLEILVKPQMPKKLLNYQ